METAAGLLQHHRAGRVLAPRLLVLLITIASGATYVWMRLASARFFGDTRTFRGFCERIEPPDVYPCHVDTVWQGRAYLTATVLIWAGMVGAGLLLASSGRGWLSIGPAAALGAGSLGAAVLGFTNQMQVVPWLGVNSEFLLGSRIGTGRWSVHGLAAASLDLLLMALPAIAVVVFARPPKRRERWANRRAFDIAILGCATAAAVVVVVPDGQGAWASLGFSSTPIFLPAVAMFAFGLLLPTRSRWWPWAIAPVAVLFSQGPSGLLTSGALGMPTTLWFGSVVRLFAIGLVAACVFPLAAWLERRSGGSGADDLEPTSPTRSQGRIPLAAAAIGLVLVSMIAASADSLPIRISVPLPTYLGLRERARDVRAQQNLAIALDAVELFRQTGDPARFTAEDGKALAPSLVWSDRPMVEGEADDLVVSVVRASSSVVRMATVSSSGAAFCVEVTRAARWTPTIGAGAARGSNGRVEALAEAIAGCGSRPFDPAALPDLSSVVATMCDESVREQLILCRSVQHLVRETLAHPHPVWS